MKREQERMNRLWWMASAVVLLFVALAVAPVAASNVIYTDGTYNNHTYIPMANPPIKYDSTYLGDPYYYVNLTNTTGGLNALHIANSDAPSNAKGACYTGSTSGEFYVTDTGGRGGQDNIVLLIAINSYDEESDQIDATTVTITASGYNWTPISTGSPPEEVVYGTSLNAQQFTSADFLENDSVDLFQEWKFAPTDNYPIFCGQDVSLGEKFKLIAIDTKLGTINGTWWNVTQGRPLLAHENATKITYTITTPEEGGLAEGSIIAFNVYAYNDQSLPQKVGGSLPPAINWLNAVKSGNPSPSGWKITI